MESAEALKVPDLKEKARGQVVITSADAMQFALEDGALNGKPPASHFMQALTAGLETGEADRDPQDGLITIDELFAYLVEKLNVLGSPQRPSISIFGAMGGELVFAYNPQARAAVGSELPFDWIKQVERHLGREDYESAFKLTQKAAFRGDPRAEWSVGVLYSEGRGVGQDYLKAREWFRKSRRCRRRHVDAQLGRVLRRRFGCYARLR